MMIEGHIILRTDLLIFRIQARVRPTQLVHAHVSR